MLTRRQLIKGGVLGGLLLGAAAYLARPQPNEDLASSEGLVYLSARDVQILSVLAPVMLGLENLPVREVVAGVEAAVLGLPAVSRTELRQLLDVLGNAWGRRYLAGVKVPWAQTSTAELSAFLVAWRDSRWQLWRSGYQALHSLLNAAWYANPASWPAIGYQQPAVMKEFLT